MDLAERAATIGIIVVGFALIAIAISPPSAAERDLEAHERVAAALVRFAFLVLGFALCTIVLWLRELDSWS